MKKFTSVLLCMVLVLSMFPLNVSAAQSWIEASGVVVDDGTVTVTVTAKQTAANARLNVVFDPDYLTYVGCDTPFAIAAVREDAGELTIGLANPSSGSISESGELIELCFEMTGRWDKTNVTVSALRFGGTPVEESVSLELIGSGYRFKDVTAGSWFFEAVDHMAAEGHIQGISDTHFGPALDMNRASFVTLLGRLEGVEESFVETIFTDVPTDSFYSGYVRWAVEKGITDGVDATHFAPTVSINRAQMVTFLYRYVVSEGIDVTVADPETVLAAFPDAAELPEWAVAPFAWAVSNGVIDGMDGGLVPAATANRAQVAVMLYRFFFEG